LLWQEIEMFSKFLLQGLLACFLPIQSFSFGNAFGNVSVGAAIVVATTAFF